MKKMPCWSLAAAIALTASNLTLPAVEIVAHRGASFDAPENTLASMKLGYEQKADGGELDIYLTRDGRIAVSHDPTTQRTGGVSNLISAMTFDQLHQVDVGKWGKWAGKSFNEPLPALDDVMPLIPEGKKLFIEIKCGAEVLPELERVIKKSGKKSEQLVIIGFGYDTMRAAKERFPAHQVYWLVSGDKKKDLFPTARELIAKAKAAGLDGLNLDWNFPIDATFAKQVHDAGLKLLAWTVDDPKVARRLASAGVDGITTNRPEWLREQLAIAP
jgi:glycerophosphoryl diester phosphodiesterase